MPFDLLALESEVRSYSRDMPAVFERARNAEVWDAHGARYIDFLSACGALNYGHNNPVLKAHVIDYLTRDGIASSMDLHTPAKRAFLCELQATILEPRGLRYKVQFPGPGGTNAVEAALKLARKVTGRHNVVAFTNAFHGMSLGALALTGSAHVRNGAGVPLHYVTRLPFDNYLGAGIAELKSYHQAVDDPSGGLEKPAAFIVEVVQGEGGLNVARREWLQSLSEIVKGLGALLIVDDIQAGCGRTGKFFSFEDAGIEPDIVCLGKSIGGLGFPLSLVLLKPELDVWSPGEHNGTFRGNNLAFVAGAAALRLWKDLEFVEALAVRICLVNHWLAELVSDYRGKISAKGKGLLAGISCAKRSIAQEIASLCRVRGMLIETCGPYGEVVKLLPPLTIEIPVLLEGLEILRSAVDAALRTEPLREAA